MKKFYYGSINSNLKILSNEHRKDNKMYMTLNRNIALIYATKKFIDLFDYKDGIIYFYNIYPNLFEKLYKNNKGYIYNAMLNEEDFVDESIGSEKSNVGDTYFTSKNVILINCEEVNVYEEFYKLSSVGLFKVVEEEQLTKIRLNYESFYRNKFYHNDLTEEEIKYFRQYIPSLICEK